MHDTAGIHHVTSTASAPQAGVDDPGTTRKSSPWLEADREMSAGQFPVDASTTKAEN